MIRGPFLRRPSHHSLSRPLSLFGKNRTATTNNKDPEHASCLPFMLSDTLELAGASYSVLASPALVPLPSKEARSYSRSPTFFTSTHPHYHLPHESAQRKTSLLTPLSKKVPQPGAMQAPYFLSL